MMLCLTLVIMSNLSLPDTDNMNDIRLLSIRSCKVGLCDDTTRRLLIEV